VWLEGISQLKSTLSGFDPMTFQLVASGGRSKGKVVTNRKIAAVVGSLDTILPYNNTSLPVPKRQKHNFGIR
jgi:hypothetical protein